MHTHTHAQQQIGNTESALDAGRIAHLDLVHGRAGICDAVDFRRLDQGRVSGNMRLSGLNSKRYSAVMLKTSMLSDLSDLGSYTLPAGREGS